MSKVYFHAESEKDREIRLAREATELNIIEPFTQKELQDLRKTVQNLKEDAVKEKRRDFKKIHRFKKKQGSLSSNEISFDKKWMRRSVIFDENGRAYIVHKVKKEIFEHGSFLTKEVHYAGKGSFGEFRILQDLETGEFCEGVKIQRKEVESISPERPSFESQLERHLGQAVGVLERKSPKPKSQKTSKDYDIKRYDIKRRIPGRELHEICAELNDNEKPAMALAVLFEVMNLNNRGICHRDLKEHNIICRKVDNVWMAEVIDFGFALRVDPREKGEQRVDRSGTQGYVDNGSERMITNSNMQKLDSYSLARILFNVFISDGLLSRKYDSEGRGFNRTLVGREMIKNRRQAENQIVQQLSDSNRDLRYTSQKGFFEMAKLYPNQAYLLLGQRLKLEIQGIPTQSLPAYLQQDEKQQNETLRQALDELSKPVQTENRATKEVLSEFLYLYNKAYLLNGLINIAKKYAKALEFLGFTEIMKTKILEVAAKKEKDFTDAYIYEGHSFLSKMIDAGDLTQPLAMELANFSISREYRAMVKKDVSPIISGILTWPNYPDSSYQQAKLAIGQRLNRVKQIIKQAQKPKLAQQPSQQSQKSLLSHGILALFETHNAHAGKPEIKVAKEFSQSSQADKLEKDKKGNGEEIAAIYQHLKTNYQTVVGYKNPASKQEISDKVDSQKVIYVAFQEMNEDLEKLKSVLKSVEQADSPQVQELKKEFLSILAQGKTTFQTVRDINDKEKTPRLHQLLAAVTALSSPSSPIPSPPEVHPGTKV